MNTSVAKYPEIAVIAINTLENLVVNTQDVGSLCLKPNGALVVMIRTIQQNKALHIYFKLVSDALNDAGLTVQETLNHQMEMEWTPERVKSLIWKQAQKKLLEKNSTTQLQKHMEIDLVYDSINRWLGDIGVESVPFPNDEEKINNYYLSTFGEKEPLTDRNARYH